VCYFRSVPHYSGHVYCVDYKVFNNVLMGNHIYLFTGIATVHRQR